MNKLIRKHQKKLMAVFGVGLMIMFAAQSNTNRSASGPGKLLVAKMNDGPIYNTDLVEARREWVVLKQEVVFQADDPNTGQPETYSILRHYFPPAAIAEIDQKPELFLLLKREAIDADVQINKDELQNLLTNHYVRPATADEDNDETVADAITDLLRINANFDRLAGNVKISQPERNMALAKALQKIQLSVVELAASHFSSKVATPTAQAIQDQFIKFADVDPGTPKAPDNPFGFGYRLPDRVKLQYLEIDREAAEKVVAATKSSYDWDVNARLYYLRHKDEFPATQASTEATTEPVAKSYDEVKDEALRSFRQPLVDKLVLDVQNKILSTMQNDWRTWSTSSGASSLGEPYPSYAYLEKLAAAVEAEFKLRVYVTAQDKDYLSADQLGVLPAIGSAAAGSTKFADSVMQRAAAYLARTDKDTPAAQASLMSASEALFDLPGNVFIYRITDVRAAEPAPDVATVGAKIESDLRTAAAYQIALQQAKAVLATAKAKTLFDAVFGTGLGMVETSPFSATEPALGDAITLSNGGRGVFINKAFNLLASYGPATNPHPMEIIEVPQDAKVFVAQLSHITPAWNESDFYTVASGTTQELQQQAVNLLKGAWLSSDQILKRTGYELQNQKS